MPDVTFLINHNMKNVDQIHSFTVPVDKVVGFLGELTPLILKYANLKE